ncbi:MAG: UDP-N-acetylglucosamine--N-acetylmuramyl-(pentapeptide) pyrophosphoryl-undecaprenol N-acetylglucosamine transferase [Phycisphaerae bacterium]|nr:UDP-N-acetylglucosamine--N-acetylmuramyl-(pentapeptide) pyrophosphoryl-undecaprenol N-acetylglucosamine transferase [Phycisphaerae bacterium]MCZ2400574.1 UDP-N-acetylglucosamine--N-acetylmuramyl-(pentapeptide) pyrophosphoryl-undecaprenol N-acetylglucosamine transferase [Phycisphaerae bacterium]
MASPPAPGENAPTMKGAGFVFAGGGTGGHLFPGLAVAAALRQREPGAPVTFFTTDRPLDRDLLLRAQFVQVPQRVRPFSAAPWRWPAFWTAWRESVSAALAAFVQRRPRAVLGLGGYAGAPAVVAARRLGIRCAILNPDAIPGRANRFLASRCDLVVLQWEASRRHLPRGTPCAALGCPIRAEFTVPAARDVALRHFGLESDARRPVLLVTGASQGASTINQVVPHIWPRFAAGHPGWQVLHLSGPRDVAATRAAYSAAGVGDAVRVLAFTHEMPLALAAADVVLSRAGASTLAELSAMGRAAILLPYPYHRDRHQHANARVLVEAGAALMLEDQLDPVRNADPLLAALDHVAPEAVRQRMGLAAAALARPSAASDVAEWLLSS